MKRILLVDDDPQSLDSTARILEHGGYEVVSAKDGAEALEFFRPNQPAQFDLVISDVRMPRMSGLEFLRALSVWNSGISVILITAFGRVQDAVWAMKLGAVDFLTKPVKRRQLLDAVELAMKRVRTPQADAIPDENVLLGRSDAMKEVKNWIHRVAPSEATVLIRGESGTGKELIARSIHDLSPRKSAPWVAINCAALPESLIESELFGYEKGAFSGAVSAKVGLFEAAQGGTLFLDEIGDMPLSLQPKILRVLQDREVRRLGSTESKKIDVRVVAATHQDLKKQIAEGRFRDDLFFRLDVISIHVPPLRDRLEDLPDLLQYFLEKANQRHHKKIREVSVEVMGVLGRYAWPGNVRELANAIERAVVLSEGEILRGDSLPPHVAEAAARETDATHLREVADQITIPIGMSLKDVEDLLIRKTLEITSGDKTLAAKILGINSRTVYRRLSSKDLPQP